MPIPAQRGVAIDASFSVPIEKNGAFPTYVELPASEHVLGTRRPVKVVGTVDGHPFQATLMPSGNGPHWLPLRSSLCETIGTSDAGAVIAVHLRQRLS